MTELETRKLLVLTTAHVTEETAKLLDSTPASKWPVCGGPYGEYGWFMYAHEDNDGTIPDDLMACLDYARRAGCDNVLFDRDAFGVDDLPTYEW